MIGGIKKEWLIAGGAALLLLVLGIASYFLFFRASAPAPTTVASTTTTPSTPAPAQPSTPSAAPPSSTPAPPPAPAATPPSIPTTTASAPTAPPSQPTQTTPPATQTAQCLGTPTVPPSSFDSVAPAASYCGSGHLVPGSGNGDVETTDWAPGMRFPVDQAPAYANSQVWGVGGTSGPKGGQGDVRNYSYPWHDDFCEARGYATIMCPAGIGHQGQDIRPAKCCDASGHLLQDTFVVDAVEDGKITSLGTYTVYLTADSGRLFRYLHMDMKKLKVKVGDSVKRGQALGYLSNYFGSAVTTFHLHFEIKAPVHRGNTTVYTWVSPYPSLVASYKKLLEGTP
jgi:murein DD-endopeptidase MepM/ murein hydrolase activator NlpD